MTLRRAPRARRFPVCPLSSPTRLAGPVRPALSPAFRRRSTMAAADSRLRVRRKDNVTQIEFVDRNILDEANIQLIGDEIGALIDQDASPRLLISFANVDHLSSAALGTLITINNKIRGKGGQLRLANIDPQIYEVFVITRLNKLFQIHENTDEAMKSFA
ncbi:MAG: STAS domain-containing protein [Phycisphaerales bacterium]|nr:STAS domain-containing protein [Phycisphaerales bacterium]